MQISAVYWGGCAVVIGILLGLIGALIKHHPLGILIDPRNKLSLSRLQVVLWTLLIVSAFSAIALQSRNVAIHMDPELWALMAISTGSAAGAIIIKSTKAGLAPDTDAGAVKTATASSTTPLGVLVKADKPRFSDLFKGEEIVDSDYVDIAKVQMFFFTVASIVGYATALANFDFCQAPGGDAAKGMVDGYTLFFPPISTALVTLIGISHAGYLTVKAAPHTPTA